MSSIGVIGIVGPSDFWIFLRSDKADAPFCLHLGARGGSCVWHDPPGRRDYAEFIAFKENFRNPFDWQALMRLINEPKVASRSARKMIVVGRAPEASAFVPAALRLSLTR